MKNTSKNKNGNGNKAQAALAEINAKIAELQQQRIGLAQPLKDRYSEMRTELHRPTPPAESGTNEHERLFARQNRQNHWPMGWKLAERRNRQTCGPLRRG